MLTLRVAFRNILRQKRRSFFTALMMAGGYWFCSVALGLTEGSFSSIIRFFTSSHTGHVQIHHAGYIDQPSLQKTLSDWPRIGKILSSEPEIVSACPRLYASALAFSCSKTVGLRVVGVDPALESRTCTLKSMVKGGVYFPEGGVNDVLVGDDVAKALGLHPGSKLALVTQGADGSVANDLFRVVGVLGESPGEMSRDIILRLTDAQRFLSMEGRFHEVAIILKDIQCSRQEALKLGKRLGDPSLDVQPWQVVEGDFYKSMLLNMKYKGLIQAIFLILVALSVLNTVLMNLLERTSEYGLMKALGTRPSILSGMIFTEMALLAVLSMIPGAAVSWAVNAYLARWGFPLSHSFTYGGMVHSVLYGHVSWVEFVVPAILVLGMAVLVSLPAAWRVCKLTPLEALRKS